VVKGRLRGWVSILALGLVALVSVAVVVAADKVANRANPAPNKVTATIPVGRLPFGVAVGAGAIWVMHVGGVSRIQ
jgi:DNA-binding beta-propeller fold protein YncE